MHLLQIDFDGNSSIGLYGFANDKFCLLGKSVDKDTAKKVEKVLKVPVHRINICGTSLVGVFIAGNNDIILVPNIALEEELEELKKLKIKFEILNTNHTALGNNILCNDKGILISSEFDDTETKLIQKAFALPVEKGTIAGLNIVGSLAKSNKKSCIIHRDVTEEEVNIIEKLLDVELTNGTVNMGSPYVRSGILANNNGFIIGKSSSGPEVQFVDEGLGFIKW